ncbi:MAG: CoA-binding protein [Anaerolineaceae bacterium]
MSKIKELLETPHTFAVVGVSQDKSKYGYELFEVLTKHGHTVVPVNPKYDKIDDCACYPSLAALPQVPDAVISAISPVAAEKLAETCVELGMPILWMPPGTDSAEALDVCKQKNLTVLYDICPVFVLKLPKERWSELP